MSTKLTYFSRLTPERVDKEKGIITGVSVITGGVQAKGHPLICDDQTVQQMFSACASKGQIKTKANHKSGVKEVNGYLADFRVVQGPTGEKLLADWHLLHKDPNYEHTLEIAERMPATVGLSASFTSPKGFEKGQTTRFGKAARVKEVLSVDFVTDPAANPDGLFEIGNQEVDTSEKNMTTEEMLAQLLKNQTELSAAVAGIQEFNENLVAEREAYEEQAELEPEQEEQEEEEQAEEQEEENPMLAAALARIEQLEARVEAEEQEEVENKYEMALGVLRDQVTLLAAQRDEAIAELESYKTPRVATSSDGMRLFSRGASGQTEFEQHVSEAVASGKKRTDAIREFIAQYPDLYETHLNSKEAVGSISLTR
jgi:hypothetical protein